MKSAENSNRHFWDEVTPVHARSYGDFFIGVEDFLNGQTTLYEEELEELGSVQGKSLLHLQCHFGLDTLSWAREGATVTGVDFSVVSINKAIELTKKAKLKAEFVHSNVYDVKDHLSEPFDIVYTSRGVLCWLKDLDEWAEIISSCLKPGGMFYLMDTHPVLYSMIDLKGRTPVYGEYTYFHRNEPIKEEPGTVDYADKNFITSIPTYEWSWSLSDILSALLKAGLQLRSFKEYKKLFYKMFDSMVQNQPGWWELSELKEHIPLTFSLTVEK